MISEEDIEKAKSKLNEILKEWQKIINIEDSTEREIESSLYMEEMPFTHIKTLLSYIDQLERKLYNLKQIEEEHKKINGELMKKLNPEEMLEDLEKRYEVYGKRK